MLRIATMVVAAILALTAAARAEPLKVELGKSFLLRLTEDPAVVVVGNPTIADVVVERAKTIFILGLEAGETNLHILDGEGKTLLQTALVVVPYAQRHVTVLRGVEEATVSCNPRCVGVRNVVGQGASTPTNAPPPPATQGITVSGLPPSVLGLPPTAQPGAPAPGSAPQAPQTQTPRSGTPAPTAPTR